MTFLKNTLMQCVAIIAVPIILLTLDQPYQSIKSSIKSYSISQTTDFHLESPEKTKLNFIEKNHWKVSKIYSNLEDVFYPFRKWDTQLNQTFINVADYKSFKSQISSLAKNEKATFVRSKKAYFFAERMKFTDDQLNQDFKSKNKQWFAIFKELFQRKVQLKNGTYNTLINAIILLIVMMVIAKWQFKFNWINSILIGSALLISLVISSYHGVLKLGMPFHWFFLIFILFRWQIMRPAITHKEGELGALIFLTIVSYSIIPAMAGVILFIIANRVHYVKKLMNVITIIHPVGASQISNKQIKSALLMGGLLILVLTSLGENIQLMAPLAYLNSPINLILAALLAFIGMDLITQSERIRGAKKSGIFLGGCVLILIMKMWVGLNPFVWAFDFIWYPIWMWLGVIMLIKNLRHHTDSR